MQSEAVSFQVGFLPRPAGKEKKRPLARRCGVNGLVFLCREKSSRKSRAITGFGFPNFLDIDTDRTVPSEDAQREVSGVGKVEVK